MLVIAGLGNPGEKYAGNRHNIGFMAADEIVRRHSFAGWKNKFSSEISEGKFGSEKVIVVKPQTFMNESGRALGELLRFYKLKDADLTVIYDELDLAPGKIRVKTGGGAGGHNGIKSVDAHCGNNFRRIRLGIGHPGSREKVTGYVLNDFSKQDAEWLEQLLQAVAENAPLLASADESKFMNNVALATRQNPGKSPQKAKKQQSHIHQARKAETSKLPQKGPMAEMLGKLFGIKKD